MEEVLSTTMGMPLEIIQVVMPLILLEKVVQVQTHLLQVEHNQQVEQQVLVQVIHHGHPHLLLMVQQVLVVMEEVQQFNKT